MVFPDDRERWTSYSLAIGSGRPNQAGTFRIGNLPPGDYRIIAVPYLEEGSERDPELLERFRGRAERITLGDGSTATIGLRLVE